jgi:hypothetical protein
MTNAPPYAIVAGNSAKVIGFTETLKEFEEFERDKYPPGKNSSVIDGG